MDSELYAWLKAHAAKKDRTVSWLLVRAAERLRATEQSRQSKRSTDAKRALAALRAEAKANGQESEIQVWSVIKQDEQISKEPTAARPRRAAATVRPTKGDLVGGKRGRRNPRSEN